MTAHARERLTYEQTLQVLLGMVGRDVNVQIAPRDRNSMVPRSGVATLEGTLHGAVDVVDPTLREFVGEAEALLFAVGSVTSGFIISPGDFGVRELVDAGAGWQLRHRAGLCPGVRQSGTPCRAIGRCGTSIST